MMRLFFTFSLAVCLSVGFSSVFAVPTNVVYRCQIKNRVLYAQQPCSNARMLHVQDTRTADQRADAKRLALARQEKITALATTASKKTPAQSMVALKASTMTQTIPAPVSTLPVQTAKHQTAHQKKRATPKNQPQMGLKPTVHSPQKAHQSPYVLDGQP
jgi:hypothetical protein